MRQGCRLDRDVTVSSSAPQDVRDLDGQEMRCGQIRRFEHRFGPPANGAGIDEGAHDHRGIEDERHERSASRCPRIFFAESSLAI